MSRSTGIHRARTLSIVAVLAVLAALATPLAVRASAQSTPIQSTGLNANWAPPRTVFIPETGQTIDGVFLDQWRNYGGVASYGNPITPEVTENAHIVQYYQYARFEYVPEDPNGEVVHLGKIGLELRPQAVHRFAFPNTSIGTGQSSTTTEMAKVERAWLPLDSKQAKRPTTDTWRYVPETKHSVSNGFKLYWEATGEAGYLGNPLTEEYILKGVTYQVFEFGQLSWTSAGGVNQIEVGKVLAKKYGITMAPQAQGDVPTYSEDLWVPPMPSVTGNGGEHWVDINLSTQYLIAYEGDTSVLETYVSTGRPGFETPTGTFHVLTKLESQTMEGVIGGEYYNVPDVPWVMYFTNFGHALHGTYWHSNFGYQMSHGCVNLPMDVAAWMYDWAPIGMRVEIHY